MKVEAEREPSIWCKCNHVMLERQCIYKGRPRLYCEEKLQVRESGGERWSREFGPVVKVDQLVKEMIQDDETKEPFARFQGQGCA